MSSSIVSVSNLKIKGKEAYPSVRSIPEEIPVALVYDGTTHAVMMATPENLEDFALGFSLTEGKIEKPSDISSLEIVEQKNGIELRMWLSSEASHEAAVRRRALLGPTGCGLCGIESLEQALPSLQYVSAETKVSAIEVQAAVSSMAPAQLLNAQTRAMHAAGFWTFKQGLVALREDVGRHNALDKLFGALSKDRINVDSGILVLTSRISVELVQKAATMGVPILAAVSAPTALALRTAESSGITLVGIARDDGFEVFTHPHRILFEQTEISHKKAKKKSGEHFYAIC
ncbi:MAG: formate dehydrogenase accessory sulfurtransferase FdhD [Hyphomicrobium sp.]